MEDISYNVVMIYNQVYLYLSPNSSKHVLMDTDFILQALSTDFGFNSVKRWTDSLSNSASLDPDDQQYGQFHKMNKSIHPVPGKINSFT